MKKLFIDIHYSFLRQPIKMALASNLKDAVSFVSNSDDADLVITTTDQTNYPNKQILYLTDNPSILIEQDSAVSISPMPSNDRDMVLLVERVRQWCA